MPPVTTEKTITPNLKSTGVQSVPLEGMPPIDGGRLRLLPPYLASASHAQNAQPRANGRDGSERGMGHPGDAGDVTQKQLGIVAR